VFFRAYVESRAGELNLTGYVHNLPEGKVEVRAEGERQRLEKLVSYLKMGPPAARVNEVLTKWSDYSGVFTEFKVKY
jgi:acylphosphatase